MGGLTKHLQQVGEGDVLGIRGPYGKGFPMEAMQGQDVLVVAGGIGLAPLRSVIQAIVNERGKYGLLTVLYGARNPGDLLFTEDLKAWAEDERNRRPRYAWTAATGGGGEMWAW